MSAPTINHAETCDRSGRIMHHVGGLGDVLATCQSCRRFVVLDTDAPPAAPAEPTLPANARYVCREHPDYAVTWRGKGCQACDRIRRKREARNDDQTPTTTRRTR